MFSLGSIRRDPPADPSEDPTAAVQPIPQKTKTIRKRRTVKPSHQGSPGTGLKSPRQPMLGEGSALAAGGSAMPSSTTGRGKRRPAALEPSLIGKGQGLGADKALKGLGRASPRQQQGQRGVVQIPPPRETLPLPKSTGPGPVASSAMPPPPLPRPFSALGTGQAGAGLASVSTAAASTAIIPPPAKLMPMEDSFMEHVFAGSRASWSLLGGDVSKASWSLLDSTRDKMESLTGLLGENSLMPPTGRNGGTAAAALGSGPSDFSHLLAASSSIREGLAPNLSTVAPSHQIVSAYSQGLPREASHAAPLPSTLPLSTLLRSSAPVLSTCVPPELPSVPSDSMPPPGEQQQQQPHCRKQIDALARVFDELSNDMSGRLFLEDEERQMVSAGGGLTSGGASAGRGLDAGSTRGMTLNQGGTIGNLTGFGHPSGSMPSGGDPRRLLNEECSWLGPDVEIVTVCASTANPLIISAGRVTGLGGGGGTALGGAKAAGGPLLRPPLVVPGALAFAGGENNSAFRVLEASRCDADVGGDLLAALGEGGESILELGAGDSLFAVTALAAPPVSSDVIGQGLHKTTTTTIGTSRPFAALFG